MDERFIIYKSLENVFTFTIKQNGSKSPLDLTNDADSDFVGKLIKIADNSVPVDVDIDIVRKGYMADGVTKYDDGKIEMTISGAGVANLVSEKGTKADRYYLKPTYKLLIQCDTVGNGKFIARVDEVFVDA